MHCMMVSVLDTLLPRSWRAQFSSLAVIVWGTKNVLVLKSEHNIKVIYHQQWQKFELYHQKRLHLFISNIIDDIDYFLADSTTTSQNLSTILAVFLCVTQHGRASKWNIPPHMIELITTSIILRQMWREDHDFCLISIKRPLTSIQCQTLSSRKFIV